MVHAPELLGYEQYTPFPAACQWQSERPPPVAGAFAGLFMALGATLLAWERPALTAGLPRAFVCGPAPFVAANSTYSLRLRQSPSEGRPALAGRSSSLPWGPQAPILAEGHAKNRQTSPASFFSLPLPFWLGAYCHLQGPPKSVDFGRKTGRTAAHRVCLGAIGPILAKGHAKNRQTSPASFFSSPLPFWLGAYCHLQGPPKSVDFGRKTGPGGPLNEFALGATGPILAKGHAKNRQTSPASFFSSPLPFWLGAYCHLQGPPKSVDFGRKTGPGGPLIEFALGAIGPHFGERARQNRQMSPASFFSLPLPFWLGAYCHLQGPPKSVDFGGKNSLVGKSMRRKSSQGLSLEATHSFSGTQKS